MLIIFVVHHKINNYLLHCKMHSEVVCMWLLILMLANVGGLYFRLQYVLKQHKINALCFNSCLAVSVSQLHTYLYIFCVYVCVCAYIVCDFMCTLCVCVCVCLRVCFYMCVSTCMYLCVLFVYVRGWVRITQMCTYK